ncbi:MAG TPA: ArsR family transcriptional regulator [Gammaproteobacteria bacterium]|nr:ArsR family transcriptional regulator [Gammaproteobacteria bacterium]
MNDKTQDSAVTTKSALQAKFDAQKIAFGPIVFQAALALRDLGILELILQHRAEGITPQEIAERLNISLYGVKVLLEAGLGCEIVSASEGRYALTKTGYFLLKDDLTRVNMNFVNDICYQGMFYLKESIEKQYPAGLRMLSDSATIYPALSTLPPKAQTSWFEFDQFYSDCAFPEVLPVIFKNKPRHILDIGGNTGKWAIKCAQYDQDVRVTIVDLPGQLAKAAVNIREHGLQDRIDLHACDLLANDPVLPANADLVWMSQFLDCFSPEQIVDILRRVKRVMNAETVIYIMELFWDRQRFEAASFSLQNTSLYFTCLANGNSKIYCATEFTQCIEQAGLRVTRQIDDIGISHTLLECRN